VIGPLPVLHAPTASGWSNSSRVGFFLLLDRDALSRRTAPVHLFRFSLEQASLRAGKVTVFCVRQLFARSSLRAVNRKAFRNLVGRQRGICVLGGGGLE
jgi:hypothetical protein